MAASMSVALIAWIGVAGAAVAPPSLPVVEAATATTSLVALGTGAAPQPVPDTYQTAVGQSLTVASPGVLANDSDPEGDPISAVLDVGPTNGSLTFLAVGAFLYAPNPGFTGTDSFTYAATDGTNVSAPVNVDIVVGGTPPTPTSTTTTSTTTTTTTPGSTTSTTTTAPGTPTSTTTTAPGTPTSTTTTAPGTTDGAILYAQNCASCHGPGGTGGFAPALLGTTLSTAALTSITTTGKGTMPPFGASLSSAEIQAISEYVIGLTTGGPQPTIPPPTGPDAVFAAFCASCHGTAADGTALGPDIRGEDYRETIDVVRLGEDSMPSFGPTVISTEDLDAIAVWISGLSGSTDADSNDDHIDDTHSDDSGDGDSVGHVQVGESGEDGHSSDDDQHDNDKSDDESDDHDDHDDEQAARLVVARDDDDAVTSED
jgi:mono/diheme cytochrome c family protein